MRLPIFGIDSVNESGMEEQDASHEANYVQQSVFIEMNESTPGHSGALGWYSGQLSLSLQFCHGLL